MIVEEEIDEDMLREEVEQELAGGDCEGIRHEE
jgi:hypothetical protein